MIRDGRYTFEADVLSAVERPTPFGPKIKLRLRLVDGSGIVYGNRPCSIAPRAGDRVRLTASITRSYRDPNFGHFGHASGVAVVLDRKEFSE